MITVSRPLGSYDENADGYRFRESGSKTAHRDTAPRDSGNSSAQKREFCGVNAMLQPGCNGRGTAPNLLQSHA